MRQGPWPPWREIWRWAPLAVLLAATVVAAAAVDRASWPGLVGDEATYLMQAQSLAWDFDLAYERRDYDRFRRQWEHQPEGLILQSSDGGAHYAFGKPFFYSIYIAPFLRLSPTRGAPLANALLLVLAALAAAVTLRRRLGSAAPLYVAAFVFASVTFAHVFWIHADLFLMCLVALAFALAYGGGQHRVELTEIYTDARTVGPLLYWSRWIAVGALLGVVILSRPFYLPLLLPAALAVPRLRRRDGLLALGLGVGAFLVLAVVTNLAVRDTWTSYGGERQGFYSYTGFPEVDLAQGAWQEGAAQRGAGWVRLQTLQVGFDAAQTGWNAVYFLAGRHVGVLPYFLPLLLGLWAWRGGQGRGALLLAVITVVALFLLLKSFNFYGGGDSLANRYFLPLYPALWFLAGRPRGGGGALLVTLAAAPFLLPLWTAPWAFPRDADGGYRYVSAAAHHWLPYETTQSHLKPSGREDVMHNGLWVKPLSTSLYAAKDGSSLGLEGITGELLVGSSVPLTEVRVIFDAPAPGGPIVTGGERGETAFLPDGRVLLQLRPLKLRARHRMWWTNDPVYLYQLGVRADGPASPPRSRFRILPKTGNAAEENP